MSPTEEQKRAYLEAEGVRCLFCGSHDISAGPVETDDGEYYSSIVDCHTCKRSWKDILQVVEVEAV